MAKAAEIMDREFSGILPNLQATKDALMTMLSRYGAQPNGDQRFALPCVLNVRIPGVDAEGFFAAQKDHYAVSNGSACNSGSYKPSYVLQAMGFGETRISESLRISWWTERFDMQPFEQDLSECQ